MPRTRRPVPTEASVLRACLDLLALRRIPHVRNNSGATKIGGRFVRFGQRGSADILACVNGKFLSVEVKRPGGKPRPEQVAFLETIRAAGGIAVVIDDVAELARVLDGLEGGG